MTCYIPCDMLHTQWHVQINVTRQSHGTGHTSWCNMTHKMSHISMKHDLKWHVHWWVGSESLCCQSQLVLDQVGLWMQTLLEFWQTQRKKTYNGSLLIWYHTYRLACFHEQTSQTSLMSSTTNSPIRKRTITVTNMSRRGNRSISLNSHVVNV